MGLYIHKWGYGAINLLSKVSFFRRISGDGVMNFSSNRAETRSFLKRQKVFNWGYISTILGVNSIKHGFWLIPSNQTAFVLFPEGLCQSWKGENPRNGLCVSIEIINSNW